MSSSRFRILGSIRSDGKGILGYMLIDINSNSVKPLSSIDLKNIMTRVEIENAKLENGEIVGTDGSLNSLPIYDMSGTLIGNQRITILEELVDSKNVRLGYIVMNPKGVKAKLNVRDTIMYMQKFGATNGKLVKNTTDNGQHISALKGNFEKKIVLPRKENTKVQIKDKRLKLLYSDRSKTKRNLMTNRIMLQLRHGSITDNNLYRVSFDYRGVFKHYSSFINKFKGVSLVSNDAKKVSSTILRNISTRAFLLENIHRNGYFENDINKVLSNIISRVSEYMHNFKSRYNKNLQSYHFFSNEDNFTIEGLKSLQYRKEVTDEFLPREQYSFYLDIKHMLKDNFAESIEDLPQGEIQDIVNKNRQYYRGLLVTKKERIKQLEEQRNTLRSLIGTQFTDVDKFIEKGRLALIYEYVPKEYTDTILRTNLYKRLHSALFLLSLSDLVNYLYRNRTDEKLRLNGVLKAMHDLGDNARFSCRNCLNYECKNLDSKDREDLEKFSIEVKKLTDMTNQL